jgi:hypothetical protein
MRRIIIHEPIWKTLSVGLNNKLLTDEIEVIIDYRTKDGKLLYPEKLYIAKERAKKYPLQKVRGVKVRIIPINQLRRENGKLYGDNKCPRLATENGEKREVILPTERRQRSLFEFLPNAR